MSLIDKLKLGIEFFLHSLSQSNLILTEDDLRCHLFQCIREILPEYYGVHSEVRFIGNQQKILKCRCDLVIMPNISISEKREDVKIPEKGYYFGEYLGIFELKLRRYTSNKTDINFWTDIKKDIGKIIEINKNTDSPSEKIYGVVIVDKKKRRGTEKIFQEESRKMCDKHGILFLYKEL